MNYKFETKNISEDNIRKLAMDITDLAINNIEIKYDYDRFSQDPKEVNGIKVYLHKDKPKIILSITKDSGHFSPKLLSRKFENIIKNLPSLKNMVAKPSAVLELFMTCTFVTTLLIHLPHTSRYRHYGTEFVWYTILSMCALLIGLCLLSQTTINAENKGEVLVGTLLFLTGTCLLMAFFFEPLLLLPAICTIPKNQGYRYFFDDAVPTPRPQNCQR